MWQCNTVLLLFFLHTVFCSTLLDTEWHSWKTKHGKVYKDLFEESHKRNVWEDNYNTIQEHNRGNHTYKLGLNMFADLVNTHILYIIHVL